jgi:phage/plasmid-associated DNA primase
MHTFGKYFDAVNVEYLYKAKKNSGSDVKSADSILAKKKNVRIIMTTEPESGCKLNTQKAKEWSGKDPIQCRDLYGKTFNFIAKFHLFIQSNFEVSFKGADGKAVGERVKVQEFPYCFIENPVYEYEKLIKFDLKEEIKDPKYFIAFFHLLKRYYFKWINNNKIIVMPPNVKEQTELMKISNDDITPFFDAIVIKVNDTSCYVKKTDLFQAFRRFYLGDSKNVTPSDFTAGMLDKGLKLSVLKGNQIYRNVKINEEKLKQIEEEELKKTNPDLCFRE